MDDPERFEVTPGDRLLMPCGSTVVFPEGDFTTAEIAAIMAAQSRCTVKVIDSGRLEVIPPEPPEARPVVVSADAVHELAMLSRVMLPRRMLSHEQAGNYAIAQAAFEAAPKVYREPVNRREKRKAAADARRRR